MPGKAKVKRQKAKKRLRGIVGQAFQPDEQRIPRAVWHKSFAALRMAGFERFGFASRRMAFFGRNCHVARI
jgi:hypothetical protein